MAKKVKFKEIQAQLFDYIAKQNVLPLLMFEANDNVPQELRGRQFLFNTMEGMDPRSQQEVIAIAIAETVHGVHEPFVTIHGFKNKKDKRIATTFVGEKKVSDASIDALLISVKGMMDQDPQKKEPAVH